MRWAERHSRLTLTRTVQQWCYDDVATTGQTNCHAHIAGGLEEWVDSADEAGNNWQRTTDALGRLTSVVEPGSLQTNYAYDALGNLLSATQNGASGETARRRSFTYDSLSRLICSSNPETSLNPGVCPANATATLPSGVIGYSYDANGNLTTKTDSKNVTTTYNYDALNRITSKVFLRGTSLSSCYAYDSSSVPNSVGRMTAEWTQPGSCPANPASIPSNAATWKTVAAYDAMGQVLSESQCAIAPCTNPNTLQYSYDLAGNQRQLANETFPPITFTSDFDSAGRLAKLASNVSDYWSHPGILFEADSSVNGILPYGPMGLMAAQYGINLSQQTAAIQTRSYDSRGRVTSINVLGNQPGVSQGLTPLTLSPAPIPQGEGGASVYYVR